MAVKNAGKTLWMRYREEYRALLKLGAPVLLTQLGVVLMGFVDTMMVGAYGVNELAASAFVNNVFLIPMVMLSGLAAGITPLVGALFTQEKWHDAGRIARAGLQINAIVALCLTVVMGVIYFYLHRFGQQEELLPVIRPYFLILLTTLLPTAVFNALTQTSNGITDTRTPMWMVLGSIGLNILGNWLLIYGHCGCPELGLVGAGVATAIARVAGLVGIMVVYCRAERYAPYRKGIADGHGLGKDRALVWRTSYPVMIQTGIECSLWSVGAVVCGWFGKIQLAAYQIVNTIGQLGFMTFMSFGVAVSIRVANYCGLQDLKSAGLTTQAGLHLNLVLATVASLAMILFAHPLIGAFTPDVAVVSAAELFVFPLVLYQYLDATQLTYINAIRGTSDVRPLLWIAIIGYLMIGIPSLFLFSMAFDMESVGAYYSFNLALLTVAVLAYLKFKSIVVNRK